MTAKTDNNLNNEKLHKLLDIIKKMPQQSQAPVNYQEYSWAAPHYFRDEHEGAINEFVNLLCKNIAEEFSQVCHSVSTAKFISTAQHWGNCLIDDILTDHNQYYVEILNAENKQCGIMVIPKATATLWIASVLMDTKSKQVEKEKLSQIEESLLLDAAASAISGLSKSLVSRGSLAIKSSGKIIKDRYTLKIGRIQELLEICFSIENEGNQTEASLVLFSQILDSVAGISQKKKQTPTPDAVSAAVISSINKSMFNITTELGNAQLKMSELLMLEAGDIILLDKMIDEKISITIDHRIIAKGWPVQSKGKMAVLIQ